MATIAKLVAEIGGDPTGLTAALDRSAGRIAKFTSDSTKAFQAEHAALRSMLLADLEAVNQSVKLQNITVEDGQDKHLSIIREFAQDELRLRQQYNLDIVAAEKIKNEALLAMERAQAEKVRIIETERATSAAAAYNAYLSRGMNTVQGNIRRWSGLAEATEEATAVAAERGGRSFAQTLTATIHRHRALIPTLAGLILGQALSGAGDVISSEQKMIETGHAAERILENIAMLASFLLPPIPGLIAAVVGGSVAAVIKIFTKAREEMQKTHDEFTKHLNQMINEFDNIKIQKDLADLYRGDRSTGVADNPALGYTSGLLNQRAEQQRDKNNLERLLRLLPAPIQRSAEQNESVKQLQDIIDAREKKLQTLESQRFRLEAALLFTPGNAVGENRTGPLAPFKVTAQAPNASRDLKDLEGDLSKLIGLYGQETAAGRDGLEVLEQMSGAYRAVNHAISDLYIADLRNKKNPWSDDKLLALIKVRNEVDALANSLRKLGDAGVQAAVAIPKIYITPGNVDYSNLPQKPGQINISGPRPAAPPPSTHVTEVDVAFSVLKDDIRSAGGALRDFGTSVVRRLTTAILGEADPMRAVLDGVKLAASGLVQPLAFLARVVGATLKPAFDALAPIIEELTPIIATILQIIAPLLEAIAPLLKAVIDIVKPLLPIIKLLAIVLTYLGQGAALVAGVLLKVAAALVNGIGGVIKGLGSIIKHIPFLGGTGRAIEGFGQSILNFGNGLNAAGKDMFDAADAFAQARGQIKAVDVDDTTKAIQNLGDAANATAGVLNGPNGFKVEILRFIAQDARQIASSTSASSDGVIVNGDVTIDARSLSPSQLFDAVKAEARRRARSLPSAATTAEAFNF